MIRECAYHPRHFGFPLIMGEIEPLEDKDVTSGICELCVEIEMEIIEEYHANHGAPNKMFSLKNSPVEAGPGESALPGGAPSN